MRLLLPIGAVLIAIGTAGSAAACFGNAIFEGEETETAASRMEGQTDAPAAASDDNSRALSSRRSPA